MLVSAPVSPTLTAIIYGLQPRPADPLYGALLDDSTTTLPPLKLTLPADLQEADIAQILRADGYQFVSLKLDSGAGVTVSDDDTTSYDLKNLKIGRNTTLLEFHDEWARRKGITPKDNSVDDNGSSSSERGHIEIGSTCVLLEATLRVVKGQGPALPPSLGTFPLKAVDECQDVPHQIQRRGGYILPLWQSEALLLKFRDYSLSHALKISVKGINAITGLPMNADPSVLREDIQDYIVPGKQPFLDGVTVSPGVTKQFVAAPLNPQVSSAPTSATASNVTATPPAFANGLQFDFFRKLNDEVVFDGKLRYEKNDLLKTPAELGLTGELRMTSGLRAITTDSSLNSYKDASTGFVRFDVIDSSLRGQLKLFIRGPPNSPPLYGRASNPIALYPVSADPGDTIKKVVGKFKELYAQGEPWFALGDTELPMDKTIQELGLQDRSFLKVQFLQTSSRSYEQSSPSPAYNLSGRYRATGGAVFGRALKQMQVAPVEIGRGADIEQRIIPDELSVRVYSKAPSHRCFVHTVSPIMWEKLTGEPCPPSMVTQEQYRAHGIPWFDHYSDLPYSKKVVLPPKDQRVWSKHLPEDTVAPLHGAAKKPVM